MLDLDVFEVYFHGLEFLFVFDETVKFDLTILIDLKNFPRSI